MWKLTQYMNISSSLKKNKYGRSELYRDQIFSQSINLKVPLWQKIFGYQNYVNLKLSDPSFKPLFKKFTCLFWLELSSFMVRHY